MGVTGKIDPKMGSRAARAAVTRIMDEVEKAAHRAGERGERQFEAMLFAAETKTGHKRVELGEGPYAGRVESGALLESTGYEVDRDGDRITIDYGAINNRPEYADDQLYGNLEDRIPAAIDDLDEERDVLGGGRDRNVDELRDDIRGIAARKWKV